MQLQSEVTLAFLKPFAHLKDNVFWKNMCKDVAKFVSACATCLQTKYIPQRPYGLLQPISPPSSVCEEIAMDFIIGLPVHQGQSVILVVVDRFSLRDINYSFFRLQGCRSFHT